MNVQKFTFNGFQENTYVLYDDSKECVIIDPGCENSSEQKQLTDFIDQNRLTPVRLINTHCHIDHVLGNRFIAETYGLELEAHEGEVVVLNANLQVSKMYGISYVESVPITKFLKENEELQFGNTNLKILFTPGHSPASLSFFDEKSRQLIAGDVLFLGSIGRTDLPGGNYDTLIQSIKREYYPLGDDVVVYPGHGPSTTVGQERRTNPFLNS